MEPCMLRAYDIYNNGDCTVSLRPRFRLKMYFFLINFIYIKAHNIRIISMKFVPRTMIQVHHLKV